MTRDRAVPATVVTHPEIGNLTGNGYLARRVCRMRVLLNTMNTSGIIIMLCIHIGTIYPVSRSSRSSVSSYGYN